MIGINNIQNNL